MIRHFVPLAFQRLPIGKPGVHVLLGEKEGRLEADRGEVGGGVFELAVQTVIIGQAHRGPRALRPGERAARHGGR